MGSLEWSRASLEHCGGADGVTAYQVLAECFGLKYVAWLDAGVSPHLKGHLSVGEGFQFSLNASY